MNRICYIQQIHYGKQHKSPKEHHLSAAETGHQKHDTDRRQRSVNMLTTGSSKKIFLPQLGNQVNVVLFNAKGGSLLKSKL